MARLGLDKHGQQIRSTANPFPWFIILWWNDWELCREPSSILPATPFLARGSLVSSRTLLARTFQSGAKWYNSLHYTQVLNGRASEYFFCVLPLSHRCFILRTSTVRSGVHWKNPFKRVRVCSILITDAGSAICALLLFLPVIFLDVFRNVPPCSGCTYDFLFSIRKVCQLTLSVVRNCE